MAYTARILVVSDQPASAGEVASKLERLGLPTVTAASAAAAKAAAADFQVDAVLFRISEVYLARAANLVVELQAAAAPRRLTSLLVAGPSADLESYADVFDAVVREPAHPAQVAARLQAIMRLNVMEEEASLRLNSLEAQGIAAPEQAEETSAPMKILFVGSATPEFMGLRNALTSAGAEVAAAFTSFTAFDYLHDESFDAVTLNALGEKEPALTICAAMRRNTRLFHTLAAMLIDPETFNQHDEAYARGASELLSGAAPAEETRDRVLELCRIKRRREHIKSLFNRARGSIALDSSSSLFTRDFFAFHMGQMCERAREADQPLSVMVMRCFANEAGGAAPSSGKLEKARKQLCGMLRQLIRAEDIATRLDEGVFAIAMPYTALAAAQGAAKRIEAVVECTAFDSDDPETPFKLHTRAVTTELRPLESGPRLLKRAVDAPTSGEALTG